MQRMACLALTLLGVTAYAGAALAGDRDAVTEELDGITPTWQDALFSIDIRGTDDGNASLNQRLEIAYEAATPGYLAYLRVSSHGDVTLYRDSGKAAKASGSQPYIVKAPLGSEQLIVLFANKPWDPLFAKGANTRELGSEGPDAAALVKQLSDLHEGNLVFAARRYQLQIAASPGGTEYTTRAIVRQVREGGGGSGTRIPSRIQFEFNSDQLTPQGKLDLDTFGEALITDLRDSAVSLEGHTDAIGTDEYNQGLSERRAAAAKQYLMDSFGIPASRLSAMGMGKENPVAPNDDEAGRSKNRRVDFVFSAAH